MNLNMEITSKVPLYLILQTKFAPHTRAWTMISLSAPWMVVTGKEVKNSFPTKVSMYMRLFLI